ncbi:hypothetical protein AK812_SmicGene30277, partial [Symbiodinium microadriaticum]
MDRMGFRVESNVLLNSATGFRADHNLKQRWVRYILAKEHGRGNVEPWKQKFPGTEPIRRDWERRPPVTEVDVTATLDPQAKPPGDQFCGFTCDFKSLTVRTFRERLQGRDWPGPSGHSMWRRDKTDQLNRLSTHAARSKPPAGVALFYNGSDPNAPPPVEGNVSSDIVMMHFLEKIVLELPEKLKDQELHVRDQLLQATILERREQKQLLQRKDQELQNKDKELQNKDKELWQLKIAILYCIYFALPEFAYEHYNTELYTTTDDYLYKRLG